MTSLCLGHYVRGRSSRAHGCLSAFSWGREMWIPGSRWYDVQLSASVCWAIKCFSVPLVWVMPWIKYHLKHHLHWNLMVPFPFGVTLKGQHCPQKPGNGVTEVFPCKSLSLNLYFYIFPILSQISLLPTHPITTLM